MIIDGKIEHAVTGEWVDLDHDCPECEGTGSSGFTGAYSGVSHSGLQCGLCGGVYEMQRLLEEMA
jgi:hypothetical protein